MPWPTRGVYSLSGSGGPVIAAGEDEPNVVYSVKLPEGVRGTPAIAHDTLFVRSEKFLYAFAEKK